MHKKQAYISRGSHTKSTNWKKLHHLGMIHYPGYIFKLNLAQLAFDIIVSLV